MEYTSHSYTHHIWVSTTSLAYASPRLVDLGWALLVGVMAGLIGIVFKLIFGVVPRFLSLQQTSGYMCYTRWSHYWPHWFVSAPDSVLGPESTATNHP